MSRKHYKIVYTQDDRSNITKLMFDISARDDIQIQNIFSIITPNYFSGIVKAFISLEDKDLVILRLSTNGIEIIPIPRTDGIIFRNET
jgi:hypothetical protein